MSLLLALAIAAVVSAGVYLLLSRDLLRCAVGLSLIGTGANLVVLASGRFTSIAPPIIADGARVLEGAGNPLPQALVLTAIVIGFALVCLSLVLVLALKQVNEAADSNDLRDAEPGEGADGKPLPLKDAA